MEHPSCADININFRPPTMSINLGLFAYTMSPFLAVGVLSLLSACWMLYPIGAILRQHNYPMHSIWLFVFLLLLDPNMRTLLSLADARIFVLVPLFGAWAFLTMPQQAMRYLVSAGLLMGCAATTRPEILAGMLFFWLVAFGFHKKKAIWVVLSSLLPYGMWLALLSAEAGRFVFGPRYWEGGLLAIWEYIPKRYALRLFGMGMYSPEARTLPHKIPSVTSLDWQESIQWLFYLVRIHPLMWVVGVCGIILGLRHSKNITYVALGIGLPYLIAMLLPQARAPLFPQANIIPLLLVLYMGSALLLCQWVQKSLHKMIPLAALLLFITLNSIYTQQLENPKGIESSAAGTSAMLWLRQQPQQAIMSSYENASLVWLSKQQWQQKSTPWEIRETTWNLYSSIDQDIIPTERPIAFWAWEDQWVVISSPAP